MKNKPEGWQTNIAKEKTREFEEQLQGTTQDKTQKKESKKKMERISVLFPML